MESRTMRALPRATPKGSTKGKILQYNKIKGPLQNCERKSEENITYTAKAKQVTFT